jgi:16S rRNA A1518/A1519 N6-dimethyltransferase RsmA/KsgA/DIM1 with predicted DNA glycosylase/AP lyase activity
MKRSEEVKHYNLLGNLRHINKESVVLDLGANIGDVTSYLYEKFMPSIYSYEPNIICYDHMIKRFENFSKLKFITLQFLILQVNLICTFMLILEE